MTSHARCRRPRAVRRVAGGMVLAALLAMALAFACGPGDLADLTAGRPDAGQVDAPADAGLEAAVCIHAAAPDRPSTADSLDTPGILFAFSDIRFDTAEIEAGLPKPQGLDLDRTCTCPQPESCVPPDSGMARACDGPQGRDNVVGGLLATTLDVGKSFGPDIARQQIQKGDFDILVVVQGWNGLPDDPQVIVGIEISSGLDGIQTEAGRPSPRFDGTDVWTVSPSSILGGADLVGMDCRTFKVGGCAPLHSDPHAYVRGGVLVAHLDIAFPVQTASGALEFDLVGATFAGTLKRAGNVYHLDGEMDGRWPVNRLLPTFAKIRNPITNTALCASDAGLQIYGAVKSAVCAAVDLNVSPALDDKGAPCDALSNAIGFTAVTATAGTIYESARTLPDDCPTFTDSCSTP